MCCTARLGLQMSMQDTLCPRCQGAAPLLRGSRPPQIGELESHNSDLLRHTVECEGHCHQLREQAMQFDARWRIMAAENERMEREAGSLRVRLQVRRLPMP